jgi:hypothetical protein
MNDETLKALYAHRHERRPSPPALDALLGRGRTRRRIRPMVLVTAAAAAILAVAGGMVLQDSQPDPVALAEEMMAWRAPTDVLLDPTMLPIPEAEGDHAP